MTLELRIFVAIVCILFFIYTLWQVKKNRLMLKYSLVWLLLAVVLCVVALFPGPVEILAEALGFETLANFIFVVGFFFVLLMVLSHARAISQKNAQITRLTQQVALLEKRMDDQMRDDEAN